MMKDRDVDLHIYTETLDVREALKALEPVLCSSRLRKFAYVNLADTDDRCLEWHLTLADDGGEAWTVDMIQLPCGSKWDGFFEDTAEAVADALTPESRRRILELKAAEPEDSNICGIEFCKAVLADGVVTWEEFLAWRKRQSAADLLVWRP